ncbi:hypothetical protein [Sphingomonas immobilis]|uniref:Uncharacterized protein n=1 Tax=Sphingomonas immobilis TaxID=3063997 RepID=A0ABT9A0V0_9SPHN|nr:hypothetical protein [Sphingomonas sp. CA1-15]MDO7843463.1 hypothetical protein [Sphingomonas sp. CA1-15]
MAGPTTPGRVNWRVNRWVPFVDTIAVRGIDLSAGPFLMQVRLFRDAPGAPLLNLVAAAANAEGISASVATSGGVPTTTIQIRVNETTIEGLLPYPGNGVQPGADVPLVWDMLIGSGATKSRWFEGSFTIIPGVTQA